MDWISFIILIAQARIITTVLDWSFGAAILRDLVPFLKRTNNNPVQSPNSLPEATTRKLLETDFKPSNKSHGELDSQTGQTKTSSLDNSTEEIKSDQIDRSTQISQGIKLNRRCFPRAPISKGHVCPVHKGSVVNCATFFEHENYEYKLLCRGELYFRPKGTHTFRTGPVVPKEPGHLFVAKLDGTGSNIVAFCFEPSSRTLGEVNGQAEFLPIQTSIASSQEAYGLVYAQGQGCVFDWVYGSRPSSQYAWDYNYRYDVGWIQSSPATEGLFSSDNEVPTECCPLLANSQNPLRQSLEGFDLVIDSPSSEETHVGTGFSHAGSSICSQTTSDSQISSSSALHTLPVPLALAHQPGASASASTPATSKSVLRRTCNICNRVLRRPSALVIHMNAHYGVKPFQCNDCNYSSTNITNLQRHQQTRHPSSSK